jgi:DNA mismatch repair protein MSH6
LTPVDRIFTRLGASDRILESKSTFFVEMEETQQILKYATQNSLVILDELGRGTSTFDGYSIAHAVLKHLLRRRCLTLFATHFHMLLEDFRDVTPCYHMSFKREPGDKEHCIRMLYKFIEGECPESFGLNIAVMAGLPQKVIKLAKVKSDEFMKDVKVKACGHVTSIKKDSAKKADHLI